jgi:hypothetical protein
MQYGTYVGLTPITEYGCTVCQRAHRLGMDPEFGPHLHCQSKHGLRTRAPAGPAEAFVARLLRELNTEHTRER